MTEAIIEAELVAACSSIGYNDGNKYVKDPECLEIIRDLLRYLRRDDSSHQIRLALGDTRVLQTDLLPLLSEHHTDVTLLDLLLRLLVNLTTPALLVFHQEIPEDKAGRQMYLKLVTQQQGFKEAFTKAEVWAGVGKILGSRLQQGADRDPDSDRLVEMCLVLLRNVLAVAPGRHDNTRTSDDADLHDQVLWSLQLAGIPDLLLYLSTSTDEADLSLHTLEIISLMLRQQDPQNLASSALHRSAEEQQKDSAALVRMREAEKARRHQQVRKQYNARHSRFGGTYCVQNMKSISDRDVIAHKPVLDVNAINFDQNKRGKRIPKNRAPLPDSNTTRRSTLAIRLFLQEFCVEFLNGAYNNIMTIVKDNLNRARSQEHDESYYLWAMKFFMEFNRHHEFKVELVSETLSIQTVHYVQTNIETYYDMMTTEKKKIPLWSRRMHNGLRAYHEIMMTLAAMDKAPSTSVRESSLALKSKLFYVVEYREVPLVLLMNYDPAKMSKGYLKDLIEMMHVFLKLLEGMCKKTKHLLVQQPQKKRVAPKSKPAKKTVEPMTAEKLEEQWNGMADELSGILVGETGDLPIILPFDALSEMSEDEQKEQSMRKTNAFLRQGQIREGISLFRASREVWPEGDIFGAQDVDATGELACLREVFMADLNPVETLAANAQEEEIEEDIDEEFEEHDVQEASAHISERELDFAAFVRRFAHIKIMQSCSLLLKSYATNSLLTNRCIIKLFHRIAWDSKLPAVFFQSSLFITLHEAMTDPARKSNEMIGEIAKFGKYIVKQFFKVAETNPKVFMEILFWKNYKEAVDIECGYDTPAAGKELKGAWSEEEEDELSRLYEEFRTETPVGEDSQDVVDLIMNNMIRQDRTRRMIIKKLKDLSLVENVKDLRPKSNRVRGTQWTDTEIDELRVLFEEYKDAMDPMARILDFMVHPKPKHRIVDKLLELGLITDKKDVRKKKIPKPKGSKPNKKGANSGENFLAANQDSEEEDIVDSSSSDEDDSPAPRKKGSQSNAPVVTPYIVSTALNKVLQLQFQESVKWLVEVITEVADDRESDGDFTAIPILAMSENQSKAIENDEFQSLMKIVGLQSPLSHEEMFWRVPEKLSVDGLRKRAQYLTQGLDGTLKADATEDNHSTSPDSELQSSRTNSPVPESAEPQSPSIYNSESEKENRPFNRNTEKKSPVKSVDDFDKLLIDSLSNKQTKKRRIVIDQSDDDENDEPEIDQQVSHSDVDEASNVALNNSSPPQTKRARIIYSDDEDMNSNDSMPGKVRKIQSKSRPQSTQNDSSDDEEHQPVVRSRIRAIVDSDED